MVEVSAESCGEVDRGTEEEQGGSIVEVGWLRRGHDDGGEDEDGCGGRADDAAQPGWRE